MIVHLQSPCCDLFMISFKYVVWIRDIKICMFNSRLLICNRYVNLRYLDKQI